MSESTNEPVILTGDELIALIKPVILAHTKHEDYTNQLLQLIDDGARMRVRYDSLSPAGMLGYTAINLLDPVDPRIVDVFTSLLLDRLRVAEPPADLPLRNVWLQARDEVLLNQTQAQAVGLISKVEVHSIMPDDLAVDWSQLADLGDMGESNG